MQCGGRRPNATCAKNPYVNSVCVDVCELHQLADMKDYTSASSADVFVLTSGLQPSTMKLLLYCTSNMVFVLVPVALISLLFTSVAALDSPRLEGGEFLFGAEGQQRAAAESFSADWHGPCASRKFLDGESTWQLSEQHTRGLSQVSLSHKEELPDITDGPQVLFTGSDECTKPYHGSIGPYLVDGQYLREDITDSQGVLGAALCKLYRPCTCFCATQRRMFFGSTVHCVWRCLNATLVICAATTPSTATRACVVQFVLNAVSNVLQSEYGYLYCPCRAHSQCCDVVQPHIARESWPTKP